MILDKIFSFQARKKKQKGKAVKKTFLPMVAGTLFCLFLPLIFYLLFLLAFKERIYPYVAVAHLEVGGRTQTEAAALLRKQVEKRKPQNLTLVHENQKWLLNLETLACRYLTEETVQQVFAVGRGSNLAENLSRQALAFWQRIDLPLGYRLETHLLDQEIASLSAQIDIAAVPPTIQILAKPDPKTQERIVIIKGRPGRQLDQEKTKALIDQRLAWLENQRINLPVATIMPEISEEVLLASKSRANNLLTKKILLIFDNESWELTDKEIVNFISFYQPWDEVKIETYLEGLQASINRPPQDALFRFETGRVLEFKPAVDGRTLDLNESRKLLLEALNSLEKETTNSSVKVNLPIFLAKPKVSTGEVNNLGIRELIGEGTSWFYGSIAGRIHNVQLAAGKISGLLVAPGEIFSFNEAVGDISAATGFKQAYIIQGSRTIPGDGGGVCQVSTTLFRAILNAGLPVEERHAHSYRVGYYEYNSDPGFDATVYYPTEDLKFKNDTPAHILIQSHTDTANAKLTFRLYGTSDGRKVTLSSTRLWDQVPPPPDVYQDDPSLPAGTVKQIDWRAWGAKVAFDWKVTRGNEVLREKTFYSQYRPWQAIFLKGTGQ